MQLPAAKLTALVGPNGAGKSTLLRAFAGQSLAPGRASGTAWIGTTLLAEAGQSRLNSSERARLVALVSGGGSGDAQGNGIGNSGNPVGASFTVAEVVAMGRFAHRGLWEASTARDRHAVGEALALTELTDFASRPLAALSLGNVQRVRLACAIAQETPVLLLDEPTAHLDPHHAVLMRSLLRRLSTERKTTVVVVQHDLSSIVGWADHALLIQAGQLLAAGPPAQVLTETSMSALFATPMLAVDLPENGRAFLPTEIRLTQAEPL